MVVPGLLESLQGHGGEGRRKTEWRSAREYIVMKMGAENWRVTQLRLVTALLWSFMLGCSVYRAWDLPRLRWVLMFHHLLAATGLDEGLLMSFSAREAFCLRLLHRGSPVTPWLPGLPKKQSVLGASIYLCFLCLASFQLLTYRVDDEDVACFTLSFLLACVFDRGLFHSTRPSDILKFLVSTLLPCPEFNTYLLLACLYFWSGLYKLRGFFHRFVFQYQFLNFSGISWIFHRLYLTKDYEPRTWCCIFGALGTWLEMLAGLGMACALGGPGAEFFVLLAAAMHVFIFFFGMGPFRWNVMTCYMLLCSTKLCMQQDWRPSTPSLAYLTFFGFVIPCIGCMDPETLGRYFGGYRMATFHFAGNEMYHAMLISKDHSFCETSALGPLLRQRAENYQRITEDPDLFTALLYTDGLDVESALRRGFHRPSGCASFEDFDRKYMFVPMTWLNCRGALLNTKWDESLPVTERFVELVLEALGTKQLGRQRVLLFVAHPVIWLHGTTKRLELYDLTDSIYSERRWLEEAPLPWLAPKELGKPLLG